MRQVCTSLVCASLFACTGPGAAPQPERPAVTPAPVAEAEPGPAPEVKPEPAPAPVEAEPEPDRGEAMPYPPGIVPAYVEIEGVTVRPQELVATEQVEGPLGKIEACIIDLDACEFPVGVLGFHVDGRVAVIEAAELAGCAQDEDPLGSWGRVARPDALASAPKTAFKPGKDDPRGAARALKFVQAQADAGLRAPEDPVLLTGSEEYGVDGVRSMVLLRGPLPGWLLYAKAGEAESTIQLVDPTNRTAHVLATLPGGPARPSLVQVVLDPDRKHLWVTVARNDGQHCSNQPVAIHRWEIPEAALASVVMPKLDPEETPPYPPGIVPAYIEHEGVTVSPEELAAKQPFEGPLARVDACKDPTECKYPAGVLGFHADGRVAAIEAPVILSCAQDEEPLGAWGRVGRTDALGSAPKVQFKTDDDDPTGRRKAQAFVEAQAKAGFTPPDDLAALTGGEILDIRGITTMAMLRAPLAGWLLHVSSGGGTGIVRLVDPFNKTAHELARLRTGKRHLSIQQVVADPAGTHLWVTLSLNDGGHCSDEPVTIYRWKIPAAALPATP